MIFSFFRHFDGLYCEFLDKLTVISYIVSNYLLHLWKFHPNPSTGLSAVLPPQHRTFFQSAKIPPAEKNSPLGE
jgi:hypothetical protein